MVYDIIAGKIRTKHFHREILSVISQKQNTF